MSPLRPNFSLELDFITTTGKPLSMIGKSWGNLAAIGSDEQSMATIGNKLATFGLKKRPILAH